MSRTLIYLDESGDLGWTMDKPFKNGGSSRMLTLAAVCIPEEKAKYLNRIVKALYVKRKRPRSNELKSVNLNHADKTLFIKLITKLLIEHPDIQLRAITVNKQYANERLKKDSNVLYNYMVKLLLLKPLCEAEYVDFIPDRRSERVNTKWNMGEYLKQMIYEEGIEKDILNKSCSVTPMDSSKYLELQFIDFYAGLVWSMYEFEDKRMSQFMSESRITNHKLFFPPQELLES